MRIVSLLTLVWLCPHALAQSDTGAPEPGEKALLFSFNGLALGNFKGGVGAKWWLAPPAALTVAVRLGSSSSETEPSESFGGNVIARSSAGLTAGAEFHMRRRRLSPFVGLEMGAGIERNRFVSRPPLSLPAPELEQVQRMRRLEGAVSIGLEYRASDRFSIAGQQALSASVHWGTDTSSAGEAEEEREVSGHSVGLGASTLTLAVYL